MTSFTIYRAVQLYNEPGRRGQSGKRGQPGRRGVFNVGKTTFYQEIEPELERVKLGERGVGYTGRSVHKKIEKDIAAATAEHGDR